MNKQKNQILALIEKNGHSSTWYEIKNSFDFKSIDEVFALRNAVYALVYSGKLELSKGITGKQEIFSLI